MKSGRTIWTIIIVASLIVPIIDGSVFEDLAHLSDISLWMVIQNIFIIIIVVIMSILVLKLHKVFRYSLFSLFLITKEDENGEPKQFGNINIMPIKVLYLGPLFAIILALNMYRLCHFEETIFRLGTVTLYDALLWSCLFGLAHLVAGVPLGVALVLAVPGMWFNIQYFEGGIELSTLNHVVYNLIIICVIGVFACIESFTHAKEFVKEKLVNY